MYIPRVIKTSFCEQLSLCMHAYTHKHTYTHTHTHIHTHTHTYTQTHRHTHIHTNTYPATDLPRRLRPSEVRAKIGREPGGDESSLYYELELWNGLLNSCVQ